MHLVETHASTLGVHKPYDAFFVSYNPHWAGHKCKVTKPLWSCRMRKPNASSDWL